MRSRSSSDRKSNNQNDKNMKIGTVYDITFSTTKVDTWVATNADSTPVVRITENGSLLAYAPTVSNLTTWLYIVTIDASLANGFEVGKRYTVYATATVNLISGAEGIDSFVVDARSVDDILPTASYTAPDNAGISAINIEVNSHPTLAEIEWSSVLAKEATLVTKASQASVTAIPTNPLLTNDVRLDNLDAPISWISTGWWSTPEQIYTYFTTDNREYAFKWVWWGWIIDTTKKHEEIIEKYEKLMKEELKKIVDSIPKADISSVLTAISQIPKVNLDDMTLALSAFKWQIKILNTTIKNDYISERNRIEIEYAKEIDKKNSLLSENEYNLKQKEEKIESLTESVESLSKTIEKMNEEHEEEMKMMDEWYSEELKKADDESEEKMAEKFLSLIES